MDEMRSQLQSAYEVFVSHPPQSGAPSLAKFFEGFLQLHLRKLDTTHASSDQGFDVILDDPSGRKIFCQVKKTKEISESQLRQRWIDISQVQVKRKKFRLIAEYVKAWALYFDDLIISDNFYADRWTEKFAELSQDVLSNDNSRYSLKPGVQNVSQAFRMLRNQSAIPKKHAEQLRTALLQFLAKIDELHRYFERLCLLAKSLTLFRYKVFSTFLNQKRWFLRHGAHPPHVTFTAQVGLGCFRGAFPSL